jgi:hypothetical protein
MITIPRHPSYFKNLEHSGNGDDPPCVVCGKGIKSANYKMVHMFWSTHLVTADEAVEIIAREGDGGDMGGYPIGPNCLRQHPELKAYVHNPPAAPGKE